MKPRSLVLAFALLAWPALAAEPVPGPDAAFTPPRAERFQLENGLSVLVVRRPALPLVTLALVVPGAGSAADPAGKGGLAAFTADLLDEGAGGRGALELAREIDGLGARVRIITDADSSVVLVTTLSSTLPRTTELLATLVTAPAFDDAEARRVRADRLTQAQLRRDRPQELAADLLDAALYGDRAPHGRPVAGDVTTIGKLTVADARAFFGRSWHPAGTTLVVAGDVEATRLRAAVAPLAAWKGQDQPPPAPVAPALATPPRLRLVHRPGAAQSDVALGVASLPREDPRFFAWEVVLNAYGGGFTGRLTQRLREQLGYLYHVYPELHLHAGGGRYSVLAPLFTPVTGEGMKEILALAADLGARPMSDAELRKAKQNLIRALPGRFEDNTATALAFAELVVGGLPDDWYARYAAAIAAVSAADAQEVAAQELADRLAFVVVGDLGKVRPQLRALELGAPQLFGLDGRRR